MSESKPSLHADGPPRPPGADETSYAERARTLVYQGGVSSLSTVSRKHAGYPFGSIMPYGLTGEGEPTFLISSMAMHTRNLLADPRATLLVVQESADGNPLGAGRVSLMGDAIPVDGAGRDDIAASYLARHPDAANWMNFGDFQFFQLQLLDVYFVGGFGVMGWISAEHYRAARADPLADVASSIIEHMNQDHRPAMVLLAQRLALIQAHDAVMTAVDRLGFHLRLQTESGFKGTRIKFPTPIETAEDVRRVMVALVASAREAQ